MLGRGLHSTGLPPPYSTLEPCPPWAPERSCPASPGANGCLTSQEEPLQISHGEGTPSGTLGWEEMALRVAEGPIKEPGMDMERQPWLLGGAGVYEDSLWDRAPCSCPASLTPPHLHSVGRIHQSCNACLPPLLCEPFPTRNIPLPEDKKGHGI